VVRGASYITYVVDQSDGAALTFLPNNTVALLPNSVTEPAVDRSMATWQNGPHCNGPAVVKVPDSGGNIGLVDNLALGGAPGSPIADITHAGWLSANFFNAIAPPDGANFILGVTFIFIFIDQNGPTDIDHNGLADVAFREIYYNRSFAWGTSGASNNNVDVESVATHEAGHAFGLGHFGKVFLTKKGSTVADIKYAPRAVMNAVYISPFRELTGTDNASFCHIWANSH
jgi:hypothetical protein